MSSPGYRMVFMPGIRPKPEPEKHAAQIRRCLHTGIQNVGGSEVEASAISAAFTLVGWSLSFYAEHGDINVDLPGIERLLSGADTEASTLNEARSISRRVTAVLYGLADRFPVLGTHFSTRQMQTRVDEIRRYFANADGKSVLARKLLAERLQESWNRNEKVVLIGHSFGSVIAYDTLWELTQQGCDQKVDLFLTLGSPLTMGYIRGHLLGAKAPVAQRYPRLIRDWVNFAAIGEVTALDRKLSRLFAPMLQQGLVESIRDDLSLINCFHGPEGLNVHKCYGYFASRLVGELLLDRYRAGEVNATSG